MSEISEKLGQLRYQSEQHEKRKNHCRSTARNVVKQFKLQGKSLIITVLIDSYFFFRELKWSRTFILLFGCWYELIFNIGYGADLNIDDAATVANEVDSLIKEEENKIEILEREYEDRELDEQKELDKYR